MTTPDPRLLVPLTALRTVPVGAPVVVPFDPDNPEPGIIVDADTGSGRLLYTAALRTTGQGTRLYRIHDPEKVALDLSPPDPPGSRVDGLDVWLRLLGRAEGRGASVMRFPDRDELWMPRGNGKSSAFRLHEPVDPNDPLALRLAVAAILRAGGAP